VRERQGDTIAVPEVVWLKDDLLSAAYGCKVLTNELPAVLLAPAVFSMLDIVRRPQ
jgi:hypothetical protein